MQGTVIHSGFCSVRFPFREEFSLPSLSIKTFKAPRDGDNLKNGSKER
jgi:hypothetical protein